ncbi:MFS transporter [Herbaspirillum lusitanum]|uniref:MFS transporter n=1 Tax=Herbaspirillum lusitanum TaxID=213312 RepID=A0ABW9AF08_9BURK
MTNQSNHLVPLPCEGGRGLPLAALLALTMASFIATANESVPAGLLFGIAQGLGVSEAGAGQLVTCCAFGSGLAAIPLTALFAEWPRRRLLLAALSIFLVGNTMTAATDSYLAALLARFVIGLATGVTWSLLAGYARSLVGPARQGRAMAVAMAGIPLALALGMPLGSWLGAVAGWRSVFLFLAAMAAVLIVWVYAAVPELQDSQTLRRKRLPEVLTTPGVGPILVVLALWIFSHYLMYTYVSPLLAWLGFEPHLQQVLLIFGLSAVAGNWLVGMLIDRWLRRLVLACLAAFVATAAGFSLSPSNPLLVGIGVIVWGLSFGGAPTLLQTALADRAEAEANIAQSVLVTVFNLAFAGSGALGGALLETQGARTLPCVAAGLLAAAGLIVWQASHSGFKRGPRSGK